MGIVRVETIARGIEIAQGCIDGGVDVTTVEPETLFKNYSIVFQEVTLFDQSVMENIRLGRQNATDEEVLAAARAAQCEEFVSRLPEGYQSNIGENGCILPAVQSPVFL